MLRTFAALVWWAPFGLEDLGGWGSGLDKHGFPLAGAPAPGGLNCRGFFGLLFSYPFGLFIPRVLDT